MNRYYPAYPGDAAALSQYGQWAQSRVMNVEVAAAIHLVSDRDPHDVWENPTYVENKTVQMILNEWAMNDDIEPGEYSWGADVIGVVDY